MDKTIHVPPSWELLDIEGLSGPLMVIGGPDVGKSTFARYLFSRFISLLSRTNPSEGPNSKNPWVAFLDGDPGQSSLGPPGTMTLTAELQDVPEVPDNQRMWRYFIGANSPAGHMLPSLVGAARLIHSAQENGAMVVIYDTSGFISASQGGLALKRAEIDLLRPRSVFAFQREDELEPLLVPLRLSRRTRVVSLEPSEVVEPRSMQERRFHRQKQYARHFQSAHVLSFNWTELAIFPWPRFSLNRLVAFEDRAGFTLALGIVIQIDRPRRQVSIFTPLTSLERVNAIQLGDLTVDMQTFQDQHIGRSP